MAYHILIHWEENNFIISPRILIKASEYKVRVQILMKSNKPNHLLGNFQNLHLEKQPPKERNSCSVLNEG